jgi:hypothetical protein
MDIDNEITAIQQFVDKGNFHAAMNIAISALNQCRREQDREGVERFIEVIQGVASTIAEQFSSRSVDNT